MDFKKITKAMQALSQLSAEDYDLTIKLFTSSEAEKEALVTVLGPQSRVTKRTATKKREYVSCARCGTTKRDSSHKDKTSPDYHEFVVPEPVKPKSARASSLQSAIQKTPKVATVDGVRCTYDLSDDGGGPLCDAVESDPIHDSAMGYLGYHSFTPAAQPAGRGSSRRDEGDGLEVSSKTEQDEAGVAASAGD